jgi:hypothetical protein
VNNAVKPISKKDLEKLRDSLNRQSLACSRIWMNFSDYKDMTWIPCKECGGLRHPDHPHTPEQCDICRVEQIMEG